MTPVPHIEVFLCVLKPGARPSFEALFCLEHSERAHARTLKPESERLRFVIGRWLLRKSLSECYPDSAPDQWRFVQDPSGKNRLAKGLPRVFFNTSDCDSAVAVAISKSGEVGLKIERAGNTKFPLAEPPSELESSQLANIPETYRNAHLLRLRTVNGAVQNLLGEKSNLDSGSVICDMDTGLVSNQKGGVIASFSEEKVAMGEDQFRVFVTVENSGTDMKFSHKFVSSGTI